MELVIQPAIRSNMNAVSELLHDNQLPTEDIFEQKI